MSAGGFWSAAGDWLGRGLRAALALTLTASALVLAWALLLNILVRDIPEPTTVAEDLVADLAVQVGLTADNAVEIAEWAVEELDGTLLDGSINTADDIRLGIQALPYFLGLVIGLILLVTPGGWRRLRWLGWALVVTGSALLLLALAIRSGAWQAAGGASQQVEATARKFVGRVVGPAWPTGWVMLGVGASLWLWGLRRLRRDRPAAAEPTESD